MRLSSHALWCETGRWGTSDESGRLCTLCPEQVQESEYNTLIQCSAFDHIRPCFPHIFDQAQSFCTNFSHNHNVHSRFATFIGKSSWTSRLATHFHTYDVKCNISGLIGHIWPPKTIIESIYLSIYLSIYIWYDMISGARHIGKAWHEMSRHENKSSPYWFSTTDVEIGCKKATTTIII